MEVVLIVLAALVLAAIVWMLVRKGRERQFGGEAEAEERAARARREAAAAEHQAARAETARAEAQQHAREAADVDTDAQRSDAPTR